MRTVLPALLLLLAGCATAPISYMVSAPEASQEDPRFPDGERHRTSLPFD